VLFVVGFKKCVSTLRILLPSVRHAKPSRISPCVKQQRTRYVRGQVRELDNSRSSYGLDAKIAGPQAKSCLSNGLSVTTYTGQYLDLEH